MSLRMETLSFKMRFRVTKMVQQVKVFANKAICLSLILRAHGGTLTSTCKHASFSLWEALYMHITHTYTMINQTKIEKRFLSLPSEFISVPYQEISESCFLKSQNPSEGTWLLPSGNLERWQASVESLSPTTRMRILKHLVTSWAPCWWWHWGYQDADWFYLSCKGSLL